MWLIKGVYATVFAIIYLTSIVKWVELILEEN